VKIKNGKGKKKKNGVGGGREDQMTFFVGRTTSVVADRYLFPSLDRMSIGLYGLGLRARLRRTAEPPTSASAAAHQSDRVRGESSAYAAAAGLRFPRHSNGKFVFLPGVNIYRYKF